eukprot:Rhum_TRINITY_DN14576_c5_g1::Rhum_TRINITY_DN14576_c5_g1_i2::g.93928::m.93928
MRAAASRAVTHLAYGPTHAPSLRRAHQRRQHAPLSSRARGPTTFTTSTAATRCASSPENVARRRRSPPSVPPPPPPSPSPSTYAGLFASRVAPVEGMLEGGAAATIRDLLSAPGSPGAPEILQDVSSRSRAMLGDRQLAALIADAGGADGGGDDDDDDGSVPPLLEDLLVFAEREPRHALPFLCRVLPDLAARSPAARDAAAVAACAARLLAREREAAARCSLLEALRRCAVLGAAADGATVSFAAAPEARLPCVTASQRAAWEGGGGGGEREAVAVAVARSGSAEEAACLAALHASLVDACCGVLACGGSEPAVCRAALRALADGRARDCAGRLLGSVEARMRDDGYELSAGGVPLPATPAGAEPPKVLSEWDLDSDEEEEAG